MTSLVSTPAITSANPRVLPGHNPSPSYLSPRNDGSFNPRQAFSTASNLKNPGAPPMTAGELSPAAIKSTADAPAPYSAQASIYRDPRAQERQQLKSAEAQQLRQETREIQALAARDREVRTHEQAHMAAGGAYAGAASYQLERGPNGVNYAVAGEVPISTGKASTPEETLRKAQIIRRAALAPAEPSAQDRKVAAVATRMEAEARRELMAEQQLAADKIQVNYAQQSAATTATNNTATNNTATNNTATNNTAPNKASAARAAASTALVGSASTTQGQPRSDSGPSAAIARFIHSSQSPPGANVHYVA